MRNYFSPEWCLCGSFIPALITTTGWLQISKLKNVCNEENYCIGLKILRLKQGVWGERIFKKVIKSLKSCFQYVHLTQ